MRTDRETFFYFPFPTLFINQFYLYLVFCISAFSVIDYNLLLLSWLLSLASLDQARHCLTWQWHYTGPTHLELWKNTKECDKIVFKSQIILKGNEMYFINIS